MATFESLQERLSALQENASQARDLISQLEAYDLVTGYDDDDDTDDDGVQGDEGFAAELVAEVVQLLDEQRDEIEEIEEEIRDLRLQQQQATMAKMTGKEDEGRQQDEGTRLVEGVRKAREALRRLKIDLRNAQQAYLSRSRTAHLRYRDAYLAEVLRPLSSAAASSTNGGGASSLQNSVSSLPAPPSANGNGTNPPNFPTSPSLKQHPQPRLRPRKRARSRSPTSSEAVTSSLLRMHASMATSLERSSFAARMVEESSANLRQLGEQYDSLDTLLAQSKGLLGVLLKSAKSDAWYLQTTVYMLLATLAWLVFRRWFYGPMWWLVWMPLRVLWGTGTAAVSSSSSALAEMGKDAVQGGKIMVAPGEERQKDAADQVVGIDKDVPTIQVENSSKENQASVEGGEKDSLVDRVGKNIDGANAQLPPDIELGEEDEMHVPIEPEAEPVVVDGGAQAVRDEL